jgi:predicted glycoside hydrolase/deacetylase ChbG (UPF0249 family)
VLFRDRREPSFSDRVKKKLIVNADDFGRSSGINAGIEQAYRQGILSSTTIVANAPAFAEGLPLLQRNRGLAVGIHLTINEYPPLSPHPFLQELRHKSHLQLLATLARAREGDIRAVHTELTLQVERVLAHGIAPTHLDGHGHCHMQPRVAPLVFAVAEKFGIRRSRLPREAYWYPGSAARMAQKWVLNGICARSHRLMRGRLRHPDHFFGFSDGGNLQIGALKRILSRVPEGLSELMCHVGTEADDPPFHIGYRWNDELRTITHYTKQQVAAEFGIEIVSYRDLEP